MEEFSGKSSGEWASRKKNDKTERVAGLGRRTREEIYVESNDSPEIPDRGETSGIPGLPSGVYVRERPICHTHKTDILDKAHN